MRTVDVIIIGGGPAGSSCARELGQHNVECLILDKETFPRSKLCAGWITPEVVADLEIDIADYPYRLLSFDSLQFHFPLFDYRLRTVQHSIRRYEFDDWLLKRCGAEYIRHEVKHINSLGDGYYEIDGLYRSKYLVGAGGTRCPVYRELFKTVNPRARDLQAVTLEMEFAYDYPDPSCHLWFFDNGLPGYSWYVPKQDGFINIGIGAMKERLRLQELDIRSQWDLFCRKLQDMKLVTNVDLNPKGYSYYIRGRVDTARTGNALLTGDALGLATRDMCEGIGPAVKSGIMAARSIALGSDYDPVQLAAYSGESFLAQKLMEHKFHRGFFHKWAA